ncbi:MAG: peptide deformylase [Eubacteriaceae bacterium]|nr:peptide deformylase [Eubacteriaceae bacterium]
MALRTIRIQGDDLLGKRSREISEINERILTLLDDMAETMYKAEGVGLAAPQVGVLRRCVVIDVGEGLIKLINPVIVESSEETETRLEGCLSVPDYVGWVKRPCKIKVEALNEKGEKVTIEAEGLYKKALCHEIDHLDGVIFPDIAEKLMTQEEYEELLEKNSQNNQEEDDED